MNKCAIQINAAILQYSSQDEMLRDIGHTIPRPQLATAGVTAADAQFASRSLRFTPIKNGSPGSWNAQPDNRRTVGFLTQWEAVNEMGSLSIVKKSQRYRARRLRWR